MKVRGVGKDKPRLNSLIAPPELFHVCWEGVNNEVGRSVPLPLKIARKLVSLGGRETDTRYWLATAEVK